MNRDRQAAASDRISWGRRGPSALDRSFRARPLVSVLMVLMVLAVLATACSGAPSDEAVREATERLLAAPAPAGHVDVPPDGVGEMDELVDERGVYRRELCSDDSCPILFRSFSSVAYDGPDDACAALSDWVDALGGPALEQCPPPTVVTVSGDASVSDATVAVLDDGRFGNTVLAEFTRSGDGPVVMSLSLGQQFCGDSAIAQACVDG